MQLVTDDDMSGIIPKLPKIDESEHSPLVVQLLELIQYQSEQIQTLRDEIAILKGNKPKPKIKPSGMETGEDTEKKQKIQPSAKKQMSLPFMKKKL